MVPEVFQYQIEVTNYALVSMFHTFDTGAFCLVASVEFHCSCWGFHLGLLLRPCCAFLGRDNFSDCPWDFSQMCL